MADDKDDDLYDDVSRMADRLKLEGRERNKFIHDAMTRGGYRAVPQYVRDEEESNDEDKDEPFFSRRRNRESSGGDDTGRRRERGSRGSDDWYG